MRRHAHHWLARLSGVAAHADSFPLGACDQLVTGDARLKEAQELAHVGSWEWNVADNSERWSEELYRICGAGRESFRPNYNAFMTLLPADDREKVTDIVQEAFIDRQPFQFEHRIARLTAKCV